VRTRTEAQANKILEAAADLFGTQRFHEVRMEDIAAEASVGKGTLYRYFDDKEKLYLALLARASTQLLERLENALAGTAGARERLVTFVQEILSYFDEHPHLLDLIQRAEVLHQSGSEFPWQRARDQVRHLVQGLFADGKRTGEFSLRDPELAALMLLGGLRGVFRFGRRPRPKDLPRQIVTQFLSGFAKH
jgi:AcrR family transcriptional regulator